jgi:hypothetical protein
MFYFVIINLLWPTLICVGEWPPTSTEAEKKLDSRYPSKFGGTARRQATQLIQFDSRKHANFTGKRLFVCLFR